MTALPLLPDPDGRYRATLARTGPSALDPLADQRFASGWMAREWLQDQLIRDGAAFGNSVDYSARVQDSDTGTVLYDLVGSHTGITLRLALLGRACFDESQVSASAALAVRDVEGLARQYRRRGTEQLAGSPVDPTALIRMVDGYVRLRERMSELVVRHAPLSQQAHLLLAQVVLEHDAAWRRNDIDGRYLATYQPAPEDTGHASGPVTMRFDTVAPARDWLAALAGAAALDPRPARRDTEVRATITDDSSVVYAGHGRPDHLGCALLALAVDDELDIGIPQVQTVNLRRAVDAYEQAIHHLIGATGTGEATDTTDAVPIDLSTIATTVLSRAESAPEHERNSALERKSRAETRLFAAGYEPDYLPYTSSEVFVRAEIRLALEHLEALHGANPDPAPFFGAAGAHIEARIMDTRRRLVDLLEHTCLTDDERRGVRAEIIALFSTGVARHDVAYPWPSLPELTQFCDLLTVVPLDPAGDAYSAALRLHHLTQALALDTLQPGYSERRAMVEFVLHRQREHLVRSLSLAPGLTPAVRQAEMRMLDHDPLTPIPAHRPAETIPDPHHPDTASTRHRRRIAAPRRPPTVHPKNRP